MSDWSINLPCSDRSDHLTELLGLISQAVDRGQLDGTQGEIARQIGLRLLLDGAETVGDALDRLGGLDEAARRQWLDEARAARGFPTTGETERRREAARFESAWQRTQPPDPPRWNPLQGCHAKGCNARPTTPEGALRPVEVERWWCPEHEHLAQPGDLEEHEAPYIGFNHNGRLIPSDKEKARIAAEVRKRDQKQGRERRKREEHDEAVAEATEAARERYRQEGETSVLGVRVRPDLRVIR